MTFYKEHKFMTSRYRIIETLNHRQPEDLAMDFGAMRSSGINIMAYNRLKEYLGKTQTVAKLYDVFQQLALPEQDIVEMLGGDMLQVQRLAPAWGIRIDSWKDWRLQDGSSCLAPQDYNPEKNDKGDLELRQNGKLIAKMPQGGLYFDQVYAPYKDVRTEDDIDRIPIARITEEDLAFCEAQAKDLYENTDKALTISFGGNILEEGQIGWGYEWFFTALALEPELVHYWLDKLTDVYLENLEKLLSRVGKYINIVIFGDDLGTQISPQISPQMYREMIKPYHKKQYQYVRNNYPNVFVALHSCGAIEPLIPDLIDAGVQVLNPVQISAKGMDPSHLKREYGKHLTFWGGGADMQQTVEHGTLSQIQNHVRENIEIFSKGGGYIFTQVHNIQANVPPQKVMAIYNTALEYKEKR